MSFLRAFTTGGSRVRRRRKNLLTLDLGKELRYTDSGGKETSEKGASRMDKGFEAQRNLMNKRRGHKMLTAELRKKLPKIGDGGDDPVAVVKFFGLNGWYWYATEFDGDDTFFGLVKGWETEWGYFTLSELEHAMITVGGLQIPAVERDCYWRARKISEVEVAV